jgi:hypothetical protein
MRPFGRVPNWVPWIYRERTMSSKNERTAAPPKEGGLKHRFGIHACCDRRRQPRGSAPCARQVLLGRLGPKVFAGLRHLQPTFDGQLSLGAEHAVMRGNRGPTARPCSDQDNGKISKMSRASRCLLTIHSSRVSDLWLSNCHGCRRVFSAAGRIKNRMQRRYRSFQKMELLPPPN